MQFGQKRNMLKIVDKEDRVVQEKDTTKMKSSTFTQPIGKCFENLSGTGRPHSSQTKGIKV
jgi:hypothetical protein